MNRSDEFQSPGIEHQRRFYNDRWSNQERSLNRLKLLRTIAILDAVARTNISEPAIVDLGCGEGWLPSILGHFGATHGVDLSDAALVEAAGRYPWVSFEHADILNWDHPRASFDIVVSQEVIEHIDDQTKYLRIALSLLKPGGYLILTTPNARTFNSMPQAQRQAWSDQPIEKWLTRRELKSLLRQAEFDIVSVQTLIPWVGRGAWRTLANSRRLRGSLRRLHLERLYEGRYLKHGLGLHTIAVAQSAST
ncbi:MAG: class I SAM-dependent methyltransferase [Actinobacteria bacterium]|nr:class I SAM-dependent methyltransferase [Actinomycetota bacterium]